MGDYVTLLGAENVVNAGRAIREAADSIDRHVGRAQGSIEMHERFLMTWLSEFREVIERLQTVTVMAATNEIRHRHGEASAYGEEDFDRFYVQQPAEAP